MVTRALIATQVGAGTALRCLHVSGPGGKATASLQADGAGKVAGTVHLQIAPSAAGLLHLVATGRQSQRMARATFSVVPYVPVLSLAPYAAPTWTLVQVGAA